MSNTFLALLISIVNTHKVWCFLPIQRYLLLVCTNLQLCLRHYKRVFNDLSSKKYHATGKTNFSFSKYIWHEIPFSILWFDFHTKNRQISLMGDAFLKKHKIKLISKNQTSARSQKLFISIKTKLNVLPFQKTYKFWLNSSISNYFANIQPFSDNKSS